MRGTQASLHVLMDGVFYQHFSAKYKHAENHQLQIVEIKVVFEQVKASQYMQKHLEKKYMKFKSVLAL